MHLLTTLQSLLQRQCWASHTWPISAVVFQSLRGLVQEGPPLMLQEYRTAYYSYCPTENSHEVSDLVIMLSTELVPTYQAIDLCMQLLGDSAHFSHSPQMAKRLHTCSINTPKRTGTNRDTRYQISTLYNTQTVCFRTGVPYWTMISLQCCTTYWALSVFFGTPCVHNIVCFFTVMAHE